MQLRMLEHRFLRDYLLDPLAKPAEFELPVRAYCVLSHAAIEEAIEQICLVTVDTAIDMFLSGRVVSETLLGMASYCEPRPKLEDNDIDIMTSYDRLRHIFTEWKSSLSRRVHENHGIRVRHLRPLLYASAIDLDASVRLPSLTKLADVRGDFAHRGRAKQVISPDEAKTCVADCMYIVRQICKGAQNRLRAVPIPSAVH